MLHESGWLGLASSAALLAAACLVFFVGPARTINRRLALLLFVACIELVTGSWSLAPFVARADDLYGVYAVHMTAGTALPWVYLLFVARAFDSSVTRVLRRPAVERALRVGAILAPILFVANFQAFLPVADWRAGGAGWSLRLAWFPPWALYVALAFLATFTIALHAYVTSPDAPTRRRLGLYVLAFGVWDLSMAFSFTIFAAYFGGNAALALLLDDVAGTIYPAAPVVFSVLLAYAILKTQLFDIDLKIKWTIKRGTVAAAFAAAFLVAFAVAEQYLQQLGVVVGGVAVGLLLFALRPLERAAHRLAERAMPSVQPTPGYIQFRKMEVYKGALESAAQDGEITPKERDILARLRHDLGIPDVDADAMERDVLGLATEAPA